MSRSCVVRSMGSMLGAGLALLAACGSAGSSASSVTESQCRASDDNGGEVVLVAGCWCGEDAVASSHPKYSGTCSEAGVGGLAICCKSSTSCACHRVRCGPSSVDGTCVCGLGLGIESDQTTCAGTANDCCRTDTGYCYCENGCQNRFASYSIGSSCEMTDAILECDFGEQAVDSCE